MILPKNLKGISVLGAGGLGANLVHFINRTTLGLLPVHVYDYDLVELSNLNRVPLRLSDIGRKKAEAVCSMPFLDYGTGGNYKGFDRAVNTGPDLALEGENYLVLDTRDTLETDAMFKEIDVKLSYNGGNICQISFNPEPSAHKTLSAPGAHGYEVTPSFYLPPVIIVELFSMLAGEVVPVRFFKGHATRRKNFNNESCKILVNLEDLISNAILQVGGTTDAV